MPTWTGQTPILRCEDPDQLLAYINQHVSDVLAISHDDDDKIPLKPRKLSPREQARLGLAIFRLFTLCSTGNLPARWARQHLRHLATLIGE